MARDRRAGLSPFDDVQDRSSAAMAHALRSAARRRFAIGCRSAAFSGPPLDVETPDHASIRRFRQMVDRLGLSVGLLTEVNWRFDALGLIIKRGTLIDATLIAGSVRRPYEGGGSIRATPRLRFTRKRDKTYFGYKAHLAVDEESGFVRHAEMTPCARFPSGRSADPGRQTGLFRRQGLALLWQIYSSDLQRIRLQWGHR
jgi:IS5 family transposase